mmetsp:Transcript_12066/g.16675  ORF Transcript_12066/g.16675 Transcript_12066/m.16675 type:complete len:92 (-) Transcript_12066:139-414(-)
MEWGLLLLLNGDLLRGKVADVCDPLLSAPMRAAIESAFDLALSPPEIEENVLLGDCWVTDSLNVTGYKPLAAFEGGTAALKDRLASECVVA